MSAGLQISDEWANLPENGEDFLRNLPLAKRFEGYELKELAAIGGWFLLTA